MSDKNISTLISDFRKKYSLSRNKAAKILNISTMSLNRWESGAYDDKCRDYSLWKIENAIAAYEKSMEQNLI